MKARSQFLLGSFALFLTGIVALSIILVGNSNAQPAGPISENGSVAIQEEKIEGVLPQEWSPFPFETALREMVESGDLSDAEVDEIMSELASLTETVTVDNYNDSNNNIEVVDIRVDYTAEDDSVSLQEGMRQSLDFAVSNGLLTHAQASAVLERAAVEQ